MAGTRTGELLLAEIAALPGTTKAVSWSTGGTARGEFKMQGDAVVGLTRAEAVSQLAQVCRIGGGVLVYAASARPARDGRPVLNVSGYGCSQLLFTRMAREEVEWTLTRDPRTFEPLPADHLVQFVD